MLGMPQPDSPRRLADPQKPRRQPHTAPPTTHPPRTRPHPRTTPTDNHRDHRRCSNPHTSTHPNTKRNSSPPNPTQRCQKPPTQKPHRPDPTRYWRTGTDYRRCRPATPKPRRPDPTGTTQKRPRPDPTATPRGPGPTAATQKPHQPDPTGVSAASGICPGMTPQGDRRPPPAPRPLISTASGICPGMTRKPRGPGPTEATPRPHGLGRPQREPRSKPPERSSTAPNKPATSGAPPPQDETSDALRGRRIK